MMKAPTPPIPFDSLPKLRIVAISDVVLHEECEAKRVQKLTERLREDNLLRNPPVVSEIEGGRRYMVLDGANRVTALREMGLRDILIQVVDYSDPRVILDTWNHFIPDLSPEALIKEIKRIAGVKVTPSDLETARRLLEGRKILGIIILHDNDGIHSLEGGSDLKSQVSLLREAVGVYKSRSEIYRVKTDQIDHLLSDYRNWGALFVFPCYTKEEIVGLATDQVKLPTGITRHIIPQRALRVNINLDVLRNNASLEDKNRWLVELVEKKVVNKEVRYYQEATFLFDE
jgi:hypothetical protein